MASLVFHLNGVPEDEVEEIRALLDGHAIAYYETRPSPFGVSHGAIWVESEEAARVARQHIDQYQLDRQRRARESTASLSLLGTLRQSPGRFAIVLLGILLVLLLTALPAWVLR